MIMTLVILDDSGRCRGRSHQTTPLRTETVQVMILVTDI